MGREFNISIRVSEVGKDSFTELRFEGCPEEHVISKPYIGPVVERHIELEDQGIKKLEVTI